LLGEVYAWVDTQQFFYMQTAYYNDTYRLAA
jgi:hypothetical protein